MPRGKTLVEQVLAPMHRGAAGVANLNASLQAARDHLEHEVLERTQRGGADVGTGGLASDFRFFPVDCRR